jgi:hypothetical protein
VGLVSVFAISASLKKNFHILAREIRKVQMVFFWEKRGSKLPQYERKKS